MKINERKSIGSKERHRQYLHLLKEMKKTNVGAPWVSTASICEKHSSFDNIDDSFVFAYIHTVGRYVSYITAFTTFRYGLVETTKYT